MKSGPKAEDDALGQRAAGTRIDIAKRGRLGVPNGIEAGNRIPVFQLYPAIGIGYGAHLGSQTTRVYSRGAKGWV